MTQIWPGFGVAPVPTVVSIICKPEAVVMVFPAVWAAAMVGTPANDTPTIAIAIAAAIETLARWRRRMLGTFPLEAGTCLAQRRAHANRRGGESRCLGHASWRPRHLVGNDGKPHQLDHAEIGRYRDVGRIAAARHHDAADPRMVVTGIEGEPP